MNELTTGLSRRFRPRSTRPPLIGLSSSAASRYISASRATSAGRVGPGYGTAPEQRRSPEELFGANQDRLAASWWRPRTPATAATSSSRQTGQPFHHLSGGQRVVARYRQALRPTSPISSPVPSTSSSGGRKGAGSPSAAPWPSPPAGWALCGVGVLEWLRPPEGKGAAEGKASERKGAPGCGETHELAVALANSELSNGPRLLDLRAEPGTAL